MKTAISLQMTSSPTQSASPAAEEGQKQVYSEAIREYVARHDPDVVTGRLDEVVEHLQIHAS